MKKREDEVEETGLQYLHHSWKFCWEDWQVQAETKIVKQVFETVLKGLSLWTDANTGEVKRTGNTALWHISSSLIKLRHHVLEKIHKVLTLKSIFSGHKYYKTPAHTKGHVRPFLS